MDAAAGAGMLLRRRSIRGSSVCAPPEQLLIRRGPVSESAKRKERVRRMERYKEIMAVIRKNGLGFLFVRTALTGPEKALENIEDHGNGESLGERIRNACEQLGPTFVKIGQILSTQDMVPRSIANELATLQDNVTQFPFEEAQAIIKEELHQDIPELFPRFDPKPIAAASMCQVYDAYTNAGRHVAVKVQRPHIRQKIELDLSILAELADFVDKHTRYGRMFDFVGMVDELTKSMNQELDFLHEADNLERFKEITKGHSDITSPGVVWMDTTSRVLTMDYVKGTKISNIQKLTEQGIDLKSLAYRYTESLLEQILVYGFFHADPHPGNVMILDKGKIEFIDLGMMGTLLPNFRRDLNEMVLGIAIQNTRKVSMALINMDLEGADVNQYRLTKDVDDILNRYLYVPLDKVNVGDVFSRIFELAGTYGMKIPRDLTMVGKCLGTAQGVVADLDPTLNVLEVAEKIVGVVFRDRLLSHDFRNVIISDALDTFESIQELPGFLLNMFHKFEDSDFAVQLKIDRMEQLEQTIDRSVNRVSFCIILLAIGIVMAGVVIGVNMYTGPQDVFRASVGITVLIVGLVLAGTIVAGLIVNMIVTSRRHHHDK